MKNHQLKNQILNEKIKREKDATTPNFFEITVKYIMVLSAFLFTLGEIIS